MTVIRRNQLLRRIDPIRNKLAEHEDGASLCTLGGEIISMTDYLMSGQQNNKTAC
jgi:hypothetical protein